MTNKDPNPSVVGTPSDPHAHVVRTLLPSQIAKLKAEALAAGHEARIETDAQGAAPIRAINEDDDGYDPYSDLHDAPTREPLFEKDPWD